MSDALDRFYQPHNNGHTSSHRLNPFQQIANWSLVLHFNYTIFSAYTDVIQEVLATASKEDIEMLKYRARGGAWQTAQFKFFCSPRHYYGRTTSLRNKIAKLIEANCTKASDVIKM